MVAETKRKREVKKEKRTFPKSAIFAPLPNPRKFKGLHMVSENLYLYNFHTLQGCEILPKYYPWRSFMKIVDKSDVTSSHQQFFKFKKLTNTDKKTFM